MVNFPNSFKHSSVEVLNGKAIRTLLRVLNMFLSFIKDERMAGGLYLMLQIIILIRVSNRITFQHAEFSEDF